MLSRGDAVVYKCRGLYRVEDVGTLDFSFVDNNKQYYTLRSVDDAGDRAYVPAGDATNIRRPVSREEALALIRRMPEIEILQVKNEKFREQEYKECIADYCPENWVKVLKTTYKRTKSRGSMTSLDRKYQTLLEHALYSEFAFALGIPAGEMQGFIEDYVGAAD
ncbi:MAG TPA: CarD family transcriptional regulator [Candidatus Mediterraneibacter pullistercoris]|nr:CarD family transcriptional regulator [Candidatus Mediterraneibacter pullistercoris]